MNLYRPILHQHQIVNRAIAGRARLFDEVFLFANDKLSFDVLRDQRQGGVVGDDETRPGDIGQLREAAIFLARNLFLNADRGFQPPDHLKRRIAVGGPERLQSQLPGRGVPLSISLNKRNLPVRALPLVFGD